jgi:hypothetical protein
LFLVRTRPVEKRKPGSHTTGQPATASLAKLKQSFGTRKRIQERGKQETVPRLTAVVLLHLFKIASENTVKSADKDVVAFSEQLRSMTDDELFARMGELENESEQQRVPDQDVLANIALVETEIERRFPGQLMAPYREWRRREVL